MTTGGFVDLFKIGHLVGACRWCASQRSARLSPAILDQGVDAADRLRDSSQPSPDRRKGWPPRGGPLVSSRNFRSKTSSPLEEPSSYSGLTRQCSFPSSGWIARRRRWPPLDCLAKR